MFVMGITAFVPVALWLPETLDPEQLDKVRSRRKMLNPLASLAVLRSPNVLLPVSQYRGMWYIVTLTYVLIERGGRNGLDMRLW